MFKQIVKATWIGVLLNTLINFSGFFVRFEELDEIKQPKTELDLDIKDLIQKHGYAFENHTVETEDGYLLELHRIPHELNSNLSRENRPVALLVHGIFVSSAVWLIDGPQKALAYKLSENGYDVWMANCRGNKFSRRHLRLDAVKDAKSFFDFSWHEIGYYDLPASIRLITNVTGRNRITYLGHSQGCTAFFVMLSERPQFNDHVERMVAMAPVVYTKEASCSGLLIARYFRQSLEWFVDFFGLHVFMQGNSLGSSWISRWVCSDQSFLLPFCKWHFSMIGGHNPDQLNTSTLDMIYEHFPSGSASKQFLHYLQISDSDEFRKYDFGKERNLLRYNQEVPPEYNFSNIIVPIDLFYGNNDFFSSDRDVEKLYKNLPNVKSKTKVSDEQFTHFNFMFGKTTHKILYDLIIDKIS